MFVVRPCLCYIWTGRHTYSTCTTIAVWEIIPLLSYYEKVKIAFGALCQAPGTCTVRETGWTDTLLASVERSAT